LMLPVRIRSQVSSNKENREFLLKGNLSKTDST
jgi:hypothetical protein